MKGYKLSTDYELLYNLIHKGFRIPAWILYSEEHDEPIYDLVEVKFSDLSGRYMIGTRGVGYENLGKKIEDFIPNCEKYKLKFIEPEN